MLRKIQIALLIAGILLALAGDWLSMAPLVYVGIGLVGAGVLFVGLETILTRRIKWAISRYQHEHYRGIAAIPLGILLGLAGLAIMTYSVAAYLGEEKALIDLMLARYGIFIFLLSLIYFLRGLASAIGYENPATTLNDKMNKGFNRLLGFLAVLLGFAGMGLGVFQFFFPAAFSSISRSLFQAVLELVL